MSEYKQIVNNSDLHRQKEMNFNVQNPGTILWLQLVHQQAVKNVARQTEERSNTETQQN